MDGKWLRKPNSNNPTVIFVHGIRSSGEACWLHENGTYWPKLLENEPELAGVGIYVYSYQTDIYSASYSISDVVDDLKARIFDLDKVSQKHPLIFVCHSMGGIVVRKLLVKRRDEFFTKGNQIGLFLVASPSLGSDYANWLKPIIELAGHSQAKALRFSQDNVWLNDLDKEFLDLKESKESNRLILKGKEIIEDKFILFKKFFIFKYKQVVPPFSGARYFGDSIKIAGSDHSSIAKPKDQNAFQHRLLKEFIVKEFTLDHIVPSEPPPKPPLDIIPQVSDETLIQQIIGKDALLVDQALVSIKQRPDLIEQLIKYYPDHLNEKALQSLMHTYPEISAKILMQRLKDFQKDEDAAKRAVCYFDPVHAPYCEKELRAILVEGEVFHNIEIKQLAIDALGRCGNWGNEFLIRKFLKNDGELDYGFLWEEYGNSVILALVRLFIRSDVSMGLEKSSPGYELLEILEYLYRQKSNSVVFTFKTTEIERIMMGSKGQHVDVLIQWLDSDASPVIQIAANVLGYRRIRRAVKPLIATLEKMIPYTGYVCSQALGNIGTEETISYLLATPFENPQRSGLLRVLDKITDPVILREAIIRVLNSDSMEKFFALRAIGIGRIAEYKPKLLEAMAGADPGDRGTATLALARIGGEIRVEDLLPLVDEAANEWERIFHMLAVLTVDPTCYSSLEEQLRLDLQKESYLYQPVLQKDIIDVLLMTNRTDAIQLANAWKSRYLYNYI